MRATIELKDAIKALIDAKATFVMCCTHLTTLIKNGKIKKQFHEFIEEAREQKKFLFTYLEVLGVDDFRLEEKCEFCKMNPESFSLSGALNVALEINQISENFLKIIIKSVSAHSEKKIFKKMLEKTEKQTVFLKKEADFARKDEAVPGCVGEYCIPQIIKKIP